MHDVSLSHCSIPNNTGDEIVLYAKFIVDHFDSLPSRMIFGHAHEKSWHQRVRAVTQS